MSRGASCSMMFWRTIPNSSDIVWACLLFNWRSLHAKVGCRLYLQVMTSVPIARVNTRIRRCYSQRRCQHNFKSHLWIFLKTPWRPTLSDFPWWSRIISVCNQGNLNEYFKPNHDYFFFTLTQVDWSTALWQARNRKCKINKSKGATFGFNSSVHR